MRTLQPWRAGALLASAVIAITACTATPPPADQANVCSMFDENPRWYDHAHASEQEWGTPIATQMAFVKQESSFRHDARPPREYLFGVIPWGHETTAYGYAQALDGTWDEYRGQEGSVFSRRTSMKHALDFIGWYNAATHRELGISLNNPRHLYLAYHQGRGGYQRGDWRSKQWLRNVAAGVESDAWAFDHQLNQCEDRFRCRHLWQVGPLCPH